jgi:hypothetical protein
MKKEAILKHKGLKSKASNEKGATSKHTVLKSKTYDEKRGNPETHGAQIKDLRQKREATPLKGEGDALEISSREPSVH